MIVTKVISGGQTGADRGGLDAAIELGIRIGGWAPKGWRAEDGEMPEVYRLHMQEHASPEYGPRTEANARGSDLTLIFVSGNATPGSIRTARICKRLLKPHAIFNLALGGMLFDSVADFLSDASAEWQSRHEVTVNIAGSRESLAPGIQKATRNAILDTWLRLVCYRKASES